MLKLNISESAISLAYKKGPSMVRIQKKKKKKVITKKDNGVMFRIYISEY